jgi:hypothetical protein
MVMLDTRVFVSGADLSGWSNKISIGEKWEDKKTTNFKSGGAEELLGGLGSVSINGSGQWEAGDSGKPDDTFWENRRVIEPWSVGPTNASDTAPGNLMYLTSALRTSSKLFDAVGEVAPWEADATGSKPLVRGQSMHQSGTPRIAAGNGTAVDFSAGPTTGQRVYANLHVLSVSGTGTPTLTVSVQSDDNSGMTTPTLRGTFAAKTAIGGEALEIVSPGNERYWRIVWTITGTTPSFLFLVTLGIE